MSGAERSFELFAVAHLLQPWGAPAHSLGELGEGLAAAPDDVIFHHAVQYQLRHAGAEELPPDDFGAWIGGVLQDGETAERVSFAVLTHGQSAGAVRVALLEILDALPARRKTGHSAPEGGAFQFLSSVSVAYPSGIAASDGESLVRALLDADPSVWFVHLVEEPWRRGTRATLLDWLDSANEHRLAEWLEGAVSSGLPLDHARALVSRRWQRSGIARRVAESADAAEDARGEARRQAVASLVRRTRKWSGSR